MEEMVKSTKKPLSSASEIMLRHKNKRRKWYMNLIPKGGKSSHQKTENERSAKLLTVMHRPVSRSLENVGNFSASLIQTSKKSNSDWYIADDDSLSVGSLSSTDSDQTNDIAKQDRHASTLSDGTTIEHGAFNTISNDPGSVLDANSVSPGSSSIDSGSYSCNSYIPLGFGFVTKGSTDSLESSEENQMIAHLVTSDSDQEAAISAISSRHVLMQHPFYTLEVWLQEGHNLVIRDSCGTSDPYVKFKLGNKQLYRSRTLMKNLNPKWDERFTLSIEDVFSPILISVYDYDRGRFDDSMGSAKLVLENLTPNIPTELELPLSEKGKTEYMGYLKLEVTLVPKSQEDKDQYFKRTIKMSDKESAARKLKMQMWTGVVTIVLVEGRNLIPMDDNGLSDPYVKFKLGNEKYRSKHKLKSLNPRWLEQFDLRMYHGQTSHLEIGVYDHDVGRDDFMGRAAIDLSKLERERTHTIEQQLEDGAGIIKLLITISGTLGHETISDLTTYAFNPLAREEILQQFGFLQSFQHLKDVGWLQVKVYKAQDLPSADIGGKSDPFCVLELVNTRLQTHTEYKTLNPEWNKVFTFNVKDIHSVLEITVFDEDRDKKVEFLGKCSIPLLRIKTGEKRWYALKDKKLLHKTKGSILLELDFIYNHIKAAIRTVNPKEEKYMQPEPKFKVPILRQNIARVTTLISAFIEAGKFIQSCFNWESPIRSLTAFMVFVVLVWSFEPYMLPLTLLILLLKNMLLSSIVNTNSKESEGNEYDDEEEDDDNDDEDREKEDFRSFKKRLAAAQEIILQIQEGLDVVASLGERVKNTFIWSVPWLTWLAVIVLGIGVIVLYYIPIRWLIMAWGVNKFTKKLRAPNAIPNNELFDFLSRVPSNKELVEYRELQPDLNTVPVQKKAK